MLLWLEHRQELYDAAQSRQRDWDNTRASEDYGGGGPSLMVGSIAL